MLRKALSRISSWKVFARNACSAKDLKVLRNGVQNARVSSRNRSKITQSKKAFVAARNAHQMRRTGFGFAKVSVAVNNLQKANGVWNHVRAKQIKKGKKDTAINLTNFVRIATYRLAAIRNAQLAALVEIPPVEKKSAASNRSLWMRKPSDMHARGASLSFYASGLKA